jgi:hypothetical protein
VTNPGPNHGKKGIARFADDFDAVSVLGALKTQPVLKLKGSDSQRIYTFSIRVVQHPQPTSSRAKQIAAHKRK